MEQKYSVDQVKHLLGEAIRIEASEEDSVATLTRDQIYEIARDVGLDEGYVDQVLSQNTLTTLDDLEERVNSRNLELKDKRDLANSVNDLLRKAFGPLKRIRGDSNFSLETYVNHNRELGDIVQFDVFGLFGMYLGEFTNPNGSSLKIRHSHLKQAKKYAELYRAKYGKEVGIELLPY